MRLYNKLRLHRQDVIGSMLEQFRALAERRYRNSDRMIQLNSELISLSEQVHALGKLKSKGCMEPAFYYDQVRLLNDQIKEIRIAKAGLMERDETGVVIEELESLYTALESGPEWLEEPDEDLFEEMVETVAVLSPERVRFHLRCGLELTETMERAVR